MPAVAQFPDHEPTFAGPAFPVLSAQRPSIEPYRVYTAAEAATCLAVHRSTIIRLIQRGQLKARGHHSRILGQSLIEYLRG